MKTNIIFLSIFLALNLLGSCTSIPPKKEETRNPYIHLIIYITILLPTL